MASEISLDPNDYPPGYLEEDSGNELLVTAIVFMTLEIVFACMHVFARRIHRTELGIDDWFIAPALVVNLALCSNHIIVINLGGVGRHLPAVLMEDPEQVVHWAQGVYVDVYLSSLAYALPKIAILGFYLRFFMTRPERMVCYGTMIVLASGFFGNAIANALSCRPHAYIFDKTIEGGHCFDVQAFFRWLTFPNIVTDVVMLILPMPMIWRLQTHRSQKIGLTVIFLTGGVGLISSIIRFVIFFSNEAFEDNTWASVELLKWTTVETGIYFIAACMPSLRPVITFLRRKGKVLTGSSESSGSHKPYHTPPGLPFGKQNFEKMLEMDPVAQINVIKGGTEQGRAPSELSSVPSGHIAFKREVSISSAENGTAGVNIAAVRGLHPHEASGGFDRV